LTDPDARPAAGIRCCTLDKPASISADELVRADLAAGSEQVLEAALKNLAEFRARLPEIDGIVLARDARAQLEQRGDS
jgi:hypothetical protein